MNSRLSNNTISERSELSQKIKAEALSLGFSACGIAKAGKISTDAAEHLKEWLFNRYNADMNYMNNYTDKRLDPRLLMDGLKSIVCVALNYYPQKHIAENEFQFAAYAYGKDYHDIVKSKLKLLANKFGFTNYRAFCDSAPVLERYWAVQSGLGWTGRNHQLIIPKAGSLFFLGELFIDIELDYDKPQINRCGKCKACIDACPTHAITTDKELNANLCLSYQTIENRGPIPNNIAIAMGDTIYGCDKCQKVCPWNRFSVPTDEPELQPKEELMAMTKEKWYNLSEEDYKRIFKGSAVKRVKYSGLMRNIKAAKDK